MKLVGGIGDVIVDKGGVANGKSQEANAVNELRVGVAVCAKVLESSVEVCLVGW